MKTLSIFASVCFLSFSAPVWAAESISLQVYPSAHVVGLSCENLTHLNHDESSAGEADIRTLGGEVVKMRLIISRFADDEAREAASLCAELRRAVVSGEKLDVLFSESKDSDGNTVRAIKGAKRLFGLNPFFGG